VNVIGLVVKERKEENAEKEGKRKREWVTLAFIRDFEGQEMG